MSKELDDTTEQKVQSKTILPLLLLNHKITPEQLKQYQEQTDELILETFRPLARGKGLYFFTIFRNFLDLELNYWHNEGFAWLCLGGVTFGIALGFGLAAVVNHDKSIRVRCNVNNNKQYIIINYYTNNNNDINHEIKTKKIKSGMIYS
jgi:hypothetical protein